MHKCRPLSRNKCRQREVCSLDHAKLGQAADLFQILVPQLDSEQQLPGSIKVTENPAGQDVGFI